MSRKKTRKKEHKKDVKKVKLTAKEKKEKLKVDLAAVKLHYDMIEPDNRTIEEFNKDYEKMKTERPAEFAKFCYDRNWDPEENCFKPMKYL